VSSKCVRRSGGIRRGMRGMCGPFGGEWAQEKKPFSLLPGSRELDWGVCVLRERHRTYWLYHIDQERHVLLEVLGSGARISVDILELGRFP
jgi:hypothetical protein